MSEFTIIKASAGSGKTHRLTREFLELIFADPANINQTLAITFTNKATAEMKDRILKELNVLASGSPSAHRPGLIEKFNLTESEVRTKARFLLKKILQDYSAFQVMTIDSFFQKVIRAFSRDLGLLGYELDLEKGPYLADAVTELIREAPLNPDFMTWMRRFADYELKEKNNLNIRKSLMKFGNQIFLESYRLKKQESPEEPIEALLKYSDDLETSGVSLEKALRETGAKALRLIEENGLSSDDFIQKSRGVAGYFSSIAEGVFPKLNKFHQNARTDPEAWGKAGKTFQIIQSIQPRLHQWMEESIAVGRQLATIQIIRKNFYFLGIANELEHRVRRICREQNVFLIDDANQFLREIIADADIPFIFEKVGGRIRSIMVDEFQDTSELQWENLKPLISSSLSANNGCLFVGDVKQSIYRFRNGSWKLLLWKAQQSFPAFSVKFDPLEENRRSLRNIIQFNNAFFGYASRQLSGNLLAQMKEEGASPVFQRILSDLTTAYQDVSQKLGEQTLSNPLEGVVRVELYEEEPLSTDSGSDNPHADSKVVRLAVQWVEHLQERGVNAGDIALLTRTNEQAGALVEGLMRRKAERKDQDDIVYEVVSGDALALSESLAIRFLVAVIGWMANPEDPLRRVELARLSWLVDCSNKIGGSESVSGNFFELPAAFSEKLPLWAALSGGALAREIVASFALDQLTNQVAYLTAFFDIMEEFSRKNPFSPLVFSDWWAENGEKRNLASPESGQAIRILTIHKAKGLQFPYVILPFTNWAIDHATLPPLLWCQPGPPFDRVSPLPVSYSTQLSETAFAVSYFEEKVAATVDNLNLLYVAFTRASLGLVVLAKGSEINTDEETPDEKAGGKTKTSGLRTVGNLVGNVVAEIHSQDPDFWEGVTDGPASTLFARGPLPDKKKEESSATMPPPWSIRIPHPVGAIRTVTTLERSGKLESYGEIDTNHRQAGIWLHRVFEEVKSQGDIPRVLDHLIREGFLNEAEALDLKGILESKMAFVRAFGWFAGDWEVISERMVLDPEGSSRIPDRVLVRGCEAQIIDFKFGMRIDPMHRVQVATYVNLLTRMGYAPVKGYLWYFFLDKVIEL